MSDGKPTNLGYGRTVVNKRVYVSCDVGYEYDLYSF